MIQDPSGSGTTSSPMGTYWYDSGQTMSISLSRILEHLPLMDCSGSGSCTGTTSSASVTMNGPVSETIKYNLRGNLRS